MKSQLLHFSIFIAVVLLTLPLLSNAQNKQIFTLSADALANGKTVELNNAGWQFRAGDDANWANPNFDDSAWERLDDSALAVDKLSQTDWRGIGWFRLRVQIPSDLAGEQMALQMWQWGASEIYLDGKLIHRFGTVGAGADGEQAYNPNGFPIGVIFETSGEHTIAVRHSVMAYQNLSSSRTQWLASLERKFSITSHDIYYGAGFKMSLARSTSIFDAKQTLLTGAGENGLLKSGLVGGFGLLFLLLYFFYPRERSALFFALFSLGFCVTYLSSVLIEVSSYDVAGIAIVALVNFNIYSLTILFLLLFLYSAFSFRLSGYFWIVTATFIAQVLSSIIGDANITGKITAAAEFFLFADILRVMFSAFRQNKEGSWILGIGVTVYLPTLLYYALTDSGTIEKLPTFHYNVQYGLAGIFVAISIYLARQFASTNNTLEAKLVEVERLSAKELEQTRLANDLALEREQEKTRFAIVEAENERRAKELEEARQLQLSMLPKKLPQIEGLEIAAYMKPATEVGGDYYDFHVADDGTLTVAVGDATGHGLKAGSVVTATKSLFNAFAKHVSIPQILKEISQALKQMNLRGLFMAMTLLKIKDDVMFVSIAGMPSALVYRAGTQSVEEIAIRAMPLGSLAKTKYQEQQINLSTGDCVVLMSDGFPEMFNAANEILGFEKAAEILPQIARSSAQEIINHLVKVGEEWANGRAQDDDVTFVVLKVGGDGK